LANSQAAFLGQFLHIPKAEGIAAVPTYTAQDDRREVVTPLEQTPVEHESRKPTDRSLLAYHTVCFLQHNPMERQMREPQGIH